MKPKLLLCLALVLSGGLFGCASDKFKVMPDKQQLTDNHRIVAEVTCVEAKPTKYTTFRDEYLRIGAMPPHVRWAVTFQVNKILKGQFTGQSVTLVEFVHELEHEHQLTGKELRVLVEKMVESKDPVEVKRLREEIHRGFYGK